MAEHNTLTDPNLHEPKGISAANSDEVYKADGLGSGAWGKIAATEVSAADAGGFFTGTDVESILQEVGPQLIPPTYGEKFTAGNAVETVIGAAASPVQVTGIWQNGLANGVIQNADTLQISTPGVYLISASVSLRVVSGQNQVLEVSMHLDDQLGGGFTPQVKTVRTHIAIGNDPVFIGTSAFIDIPTPDTLVAMFVANNNLTNNIILTYANFCASFADLT